MEGRVSGVEREGKRRNIEKTTGAFGEREEVKEKARVMRDVGVTMPGEETMRGFTKRLGAKMRKRGEEE